MLKAHRFGVPIVPRAYRDYVGGEDDA